MRRTKDRKKDRKKDGIKSNAKSVNAGKKGSSCFAI
jgi:hypothetical protein